MTGETESSGMGYAKFFTVRPNIWMKMENTSTGNATYVVNMFIIRMA
jgi:hypothetical protein